MTTEEKLERIKEQNRLRQQKYYKINKLKVLERQKYVRDLGKEFLKMKINDNSNQELHPNSQFIYTNQPNNITLEIDHLANKKRDTLEKLNKKFKKNNIITDINQPISLEMCLDLISVMKYTNKDIPLAESTKTKIKKNIKQYFNFIGINDLRPSLNHPEYIKEILDKQNLGDVNKSDIVVAILKLLNDNIIPNYLKEKYDIVDYIYNSYKKLSDENREEKKKQEVDNIEDIKKLIKEKYGKNSKNYIILMLYIEVPKRDDFHLKIIENDDEIIDENENYIIVPNNKEKPVKIYIQSHKTKNKYDSEFEELSIKLSKLIRKYIRENELEFNDYLFKEKKLSRFLKKMFISIDKPEINGVNSLRHIIVSSNYNNPNLTIEDANKLANTMKHDLRTQNQYRRKIKN